MKQALAIFAKTPLPGMVKTRLSPPLLPEEAADLYRCMLLDTLEKAASLRVDTFIFYDGDESFFRQAAPALPLVRQAGDSLGHRLDHAFTHLASQGYDARIVIGTDAPDLPVEFIAKAFTLMRTGTQVVYGPAEDGGYYLVGLNCGHGGLFSDIPWSTSQVLEKSLQRAQAAGFTSSLLPMWYDIDVIEDLYRPGLSDCRNGAPLTRDFIRGLGIKSVRAADAK